MGGMTDILLIIISALLGALLVSLRKLFKMLDAWRYEWWQRTPRQMSDSEIMANIYSDDKNNKQSP